MLVTSVKEPTSDDGEKRLSGGDHKLADALPDALRPAEPRESEWMRGPMRLICGFIIILWERPMFSSGHWRVDDDGHENEQNSKWRGLRS